MTFKTWDFRGVFKEDFEGFLKGILRGHGGVLEGGLEGRFGGRLGGGLQRGLQTGLGRGLAVKLRSGLVQVWSRSGPGLVQYRLKFNSFELDSEVGRLVAIYFGKKWYSYIYM